MELQGSCRCGLVKFSLNSRTPAPYMRCYCSICRKVAGSGGFGINVMGQVSPSKARVNTIPVCSGGVAAAVERRHRRMMLSKCSTTV